VCCLVTAFIRSRILDTVRKAGNQGHILNLGHGVLPNTRKKMLSFETVKQLNYSKEAELDETCLQPQDCLTPVTVAITYETVRVG